MDWVYKFINLTLTNEFQKYVMLSLAEFTAKGK